MSLSNRNLNSSNWDGGGRVKELWLLDGMVDGGNLLFQKYN